MPRPNQPRSIASEEQLARRIAYEREARGWSYDGLAARMTKVGCAIQSSAIYKIEKSDPPRRITVNELVGFTKVFETSVAKLLLPPEMVIADELADLVVAWDQAADTAAAAKDKEEETWDALRRWVSTHPEHGGEVEAVFRRWSETYYDDQHDFRVAYRMFKLTKDSAWADRVRQLLDEEETG